MYNLYPALAGDVLVLVLVSPTNTAAVVPSVIFIPYCVLEPLPNIVDAFGVLPPTVVTPLESIVDPL